MATTSTLHADEQRQRKRIWPTVRKHLIKIVLLVAVSTAAMAIYVQLRASQYIAYTEVLIEQSDRDYHDVGRGDSDDEPPVSPEELEIELRRVSSALILQDVIKGLGLKFDQREVFNFKVWVQALLSDDKDDGGSDDSRLSLVNQLESFRKNLVIKRDPLASVISIGYRAPDPEMSANVANALARAYLRNRTADQQQAIEKAVHDLQRVADKISASILTAERATEQFRAEAGLYAIDGVLPVERHYNRLSQEFTEAALDLADARARLSKADAALVGRLAADGGDDVQTSSLIDRLRAENAESGQQISTSDLSAGSYPVVTERDERESGAALDNGEDVVPSEDGGVVDQNRSLVATAEARYKELEAQVKNARRELSSSWDRRLRLRELERTVADLRQSYPPILERLQRAHEQKQLRTNSARIIATAEVPTKSSNVNGAWLIGIALIGSCATGLGWAWFGETRSLGFNDAFEVETELGQPVLGMLPMVNHAAPIVADPDISSRERQWSLEAYGFLEGVRSILNTILPNHRGAGPTVGKVVLITSCFPNEGKTTLALSLTRQAALGGAKSVLVEGDMRKAGLKAKLCTVAPEKGLVDLMQGTTDEIDDALVNEPDSGADLLLAAGPCEDAFALSRSPRMKVVIDALKQRYELIVIDCPPILGVSDTRAMSDMADEILFVVRWQNTHKVVAKSALRELEREKMQIAGVVLTQVDLAQHLMYNTPDRFSYQDAYEAYTAVALREGASKKEPA